MKVDVPELEGCVYFRPITPQIEADLAKNANERDYVIGMTALILDENGNRLFSEEQVEQMSYKDLAIVIKACVEAVAVKKKS